MLTNLVKCFLVATLAISLFGCEPRPVVVDPNEDDATVVEERDTVIDRDIDTADPGTGVDVNVGGERGAEVDVDSGTAEPEQNP